VSNQRTKKTADEKASVKVGKLSQRDRELKSGEAKNIRGGGGPSGGVNGDKSGQISTTFGR
jgi:hypothetical protein